MSDSIIVSGQSRVWIVEGGTSPFVDPEYEGLMKLNDPSWNLGSVTAIRKPDPNRFNAFVEAGKVRGAADRVSLGVMGRYPEQASELLRLARLTCRIDVQSHIGACRRGANPQDYLAGWSKILVFRDAEINTYSQSNAGAIDDGENNPYNENADITAKDMYEIVPLAFGQQASVLSTKEIKTIDVCDQADCGDCGEASDGCQRVLATMIGVGTTPGTDNKVLYTSDGGATWGSISISTLLGNEPPSDAECVGIYYIVVSNASNSIHYATTADVLKGTATFTEVGTGFLDAGSPNAMWAVDPRHIWVAGDAGYIYFSSNILTGVSVQDAGVATSQNLLDVHAIDTNGIAAVGVLNAVAYSANGGQTWASVIGPAAGITLTAVWMLKSDMWLVGTIDGRLFATRDSGQNWTQIGLPSSVTRIDDIKFVDDTVGYIAARTATIGIILRTTDGGRDWYTLPESGLQLPDADAFNQIAVCKEVHNTVFAAGLAGNATNGIIIKGAGA